MGVAAAYVADLKRLTRDGRSPKDSNSLGVATLMNFSMYVAARCTTKQLLKSYGEEGVANTPFG